jgi:hypothetical protein
VVSSGSVLKPLRQPEVDNVDGIESDDIGYLLPLVRAHQKVFWFHVAVNVSLGVNERNNVNL